MYFSTFHSFHLLFHSFSPSAFCPFFFGLDQPGFGFSTEQEGELAALVYFFFDSATQGPFQEDILRMRDLV